MNKLMETLKDSAKKLEKKDGSPKTESWWPQTGEVEQDKTSPIECVIGMERCDLIWIVHPGSGMEKETSREGFMNYK